MFIRKLFDKSVFAPGLIAIAVVMIMFAQAFAVEPQMASYTSYPIFISSSVTPNVMIILDNSGSMNEAAYPVGQPYDNFGKKTIVARDSLDDVEELVDFGTQGSSYSYSNDLDIGGLNTGVAGDRILIGLRFAQVGIPKGSTINKAEIQFKACANTAAAASFTITGILETNTESFLANSWQPNDGSYNVGNRPETTATVAWAPGAWTSSTTTIYRTPELKTIVQEMVNQNAWTDNSAMGFKIKPGTGKRDAYAADNGANTAPALYIEFTPPPGSRMGYYGYFDPASRYSYASGKFTRNPNGPWSGDWLNWVCMRKIDVTRKVMMGGLATARTGGGNQTLFGEAPGWGSRIFQKTYNNASATTGENPFVGNKTWRIENGYLIDTGTGTRYSIAVQKDATQEPNDFVDGNLSGVLQKVGDKVRWGNMWFYNGTGTNQEGGFVSNPMGTNLTTLVTDLQNTAANTWTPLAEAYYVCARYFMQVKPIAGLGYHTSAIGAINNTNDPYYDTDFLSCAKSFVILLTDGASTKDTKIPADLKDYDADGDRINCTENDCEYDSGGSDYLDDVALWARTTDLRPDGGTKALDGDQNLILYTVYAFGNDPNAQHLLQDASRNGGFEDTNGNKLPDLDAEWDENADGLPDTYFEASDGYQLEKEIMRALTDILKRASSGTAVSVLATSSEGEGTLVQAYFKPSVTEDLEEITWVGYLHTLWVDSFGNAREDTLPQGAEPGLDIFTDRIVEFFYDDRSGEAKFKRFALDPDGNKQVTFTDLNGNGTLDPPEPFIDVNDNGTWDDGETFVDANSNGVLDLGEPYTDINGDGQWDEGDTFTDANANGRWDDDEPFIDMNGDGVCCAPAETWIENPAYTAGVYDPPEPFVDANSNGVWDSAEGDEATWTPCANPGDYALGNCDDRDGDGVWNPAEDFTNLTDPGYGGGYDPGDFCAVHDWDDNGVWNEGEPFIDSNGDNQYTAGVDAFNANTSCDLNLDGQLTPAETFTDQNGDGAWNHAEPFTDLNANGIYDSPEPYVDEDGNGTYSAGESFTDSNGNHYYDPPEPFTDLDGDGDWDDGEPWSYVFTVHLMDELQTVWEAGRHLAARDPATRVMKTFIDANFNGIVDVDEYIDFSTANAADIQPYLGVMPDVDYLDLGPNHDARTENLINFIRGQGSGFNGVTNMRNRTIGGQVWKLGDIIYSTPMTVGRPLDNYGLIYGDPTYQEYFNQKREREQMVYVGANDGMLHAFLMGHYNVGDNPDTSGISESIFYDKPGSTTEGFGDEVWAYIPQALLPHLKWLADPDYTHVYYVDLKPRIVDAKLWAASDPDHPQGWGTVLLGGLNYGGKSIWSTSTFADGSTNRTFTSSFFAIDITDPHNPNLLWERTFPTIGLTTAPPTVAKVHDEWFAIFGSGPTDYAGTSSQRPHIYVLDLENGTLRRNHEIPVNSSFMGAGPITVDMGLNYSVDVGYIGLVYQQGSTWRGQMYRMFVPKTSGDFRDISAGAAYNTDPATWEFRRMLDVLGPVTAPPSASVDGFDNLWVYFGTGRFMSDADKTDLSAQYFYGIKDPYYSHAADGSFKHPTKAAADAANINNLLPSTPIEVFTDATITGHPTAGVDTWNEMLTNMRSRDGWYMIMGQTAGTLGERVLNKPTVLGGIVFDTTYVPNQDPCGFGGGSNLLGLYYETGTAWTDEVFLGGSTEVSVGGETKRRVSRSVNLGVGRGSSVSIHLGKQEGATAFIQQSTNTMLTQAVTPAFNVRSGFVFWREH